MWWLPGALIPFRDSKHLAGTTVRVAESSRFALIDVVTLCRLAMGERDLYKQLDLRLRIETAGTPVLIERALLDPEARPLPTAGSRGRFTCFGSLNVWLSYATDRRMRRPGPVVGSGRRIRPDGRAGVVAGSSSTAVGAVHAASQGRTRSATGAYQLRIRLEGDRTLQQTRADCAS